MKVDEKRRVKRKERMTRALDIEKTLSKGGDFDFVEECAEK